MCHRCCKNIERKMSSGISNIETEEGVDSARESSPIDFLHSVTENNSDDGGGGVDYGVVQHLGYDDSQFGFKLLNKMEDLDRYEKLA
jgi:hypothetical protein